MPYWEALGENYLSSLGITAKPDFDKHIRSMYLMESAEYIKNEYPINKSCDEILSDIKGLVKKYYFEEIKLKDGVREMLDALKMCIRDSSYIHPESPITDPACHHKDDG